MPYFIVVTKEVLYQATPVEADSPETAACSVKAGEGIDGFLKYRRPFSLEDQEVVVVEWDCGTKCAVCNHGIRWQDAVVSENGNPVHILCLQDTWTRLGEDYRPWYLR